MSIISTSQVDRVDLGGTLMPLVSTQDNAEVQKAYNTRISELQDYPSTVITIIAVALGIILFVVGLYLKIQGSAIGLNVTGADIGGIVAMIIAIIPFGIAICRYLHLQKRKKNYTDNQVQYQGLAREVANEVLFRKAQKIIPQLLEKNEFCIVHNRTTSEIFISSQIAQFRNKSFSIQRDDTDSLEYILDKMSYELPLYLTPSKRVTVEELSLRMQNTRPNTNQTNTQNIPYGDGKTVAWPNEIPAPANLATYDPDAINLFVQIATASSLNTIVLPDVSLNCMSKCFSLAKKTKQQAVCTFLVDNLATKLTQDNDTVLQVLHFALIHKLPELEGACFRRLRGVDLDTLRELVQTEGSKIHAPKNLIASHLLGDGGITACNPETFTRLAEVFDFSAVHQILWDIPIEHFVSSMTPIARHFVNLQHLSINSYRMRNIYNMVYQYRALKLLIQFCNHHLPSLELIDGVHIFHGSLGGRSTYESYNDMPSSPNAFVPIPNYRELALVRQGTTRQRVQTLLDTFKVKLTTE